WIVQWSAGYRNLFRIGGLGECPLGQPCAALFTPSGPQWSTSVDHADKVGVDIICHASTCPANDPGFGPAASLNVGELDVTIDEPTPPSFTVSGSLTSGAPWFSANAATGTQNPSLFYNAVDPAGICNFQAEIVNAAGVVEQSDSHNVAPDYTQSKPCPTRPSNGYTWTPNIAALPDGPNYLRIEASNPAGMTSQATGPSGVLLDVDNRLKP
ncbi:MAG: hypothetical protein ABSG43_01010, partial [Solirubrobacteraceae bacterium]